MPIAAVIFDLDDTLMPEHPADYAALEATAGALPDDASLQPVEFRRVMVDGARSHWEGTPTQTYAHTIGTSALKMLWAPEDRSKPGLALLTDFAPGIRESVWRTVAQAAGADPHATWHMLDERFRRERGIRHRPYDDAIPALEKLRGKYRLGLLTNGTPKVQRHKASVAGLLDYFDEVLVSGDVELRKPDARLFELLLERLDANADSAVLVGDRPATDIAGANAAGIRSIQIRRPDNNHAMDGEATPDAIITSLEELSRLLQ